MVGTKPNLTLTSSLEKGDDPELDTSKCLDSDSVQQYQSVIGSIQWCVSLGILDINTTVMTLASLRDETRKGRLNRCKRVISYQV